MLCREILKINFFFFFFFFSAQRNLNARQSIQSLLLKIIISCYMTYNPRAGPSLGDTILAAPVRAPPIAICPEPSAPTDDLVLGAVVFLDVPTLRRFAPPRLFFFGGIIT
jgi:hypothetical protein